MSLIKVSLLVLTLLSVSATFFKAHHSFHFGWGDGAGNGVKSFSLYPEFYQYSCPQIDDIIMSVLEKGCDASILLDDSTTIVGEKNFGPNKNSIRGFEVIDDIKSKLEEACPHTVSCADIVALAARGSILLSGGPNWELPLGRRDSKTASLSLSNKSIPPPNSTIQTLITFFKRQGLDEVDLVALSGGHTIGMARCGTFKQRLYNQSNETLEKSFYFGLKTVCPKSGGDNNIVPLDYGSPRKFDNSYFKLILWEKGLLNSDEVLLTVNSTVK